MTAYRKGANFERALVRQFWDSGWIALRTAGSGSSKFLIPDVVAIKDKDVIILECKTTTKDRLSLKKEILDLSELAKRTGARVYLAIKFHREKPRFYRVDSLKSNTVSKKNIFINFDALIGKQNRLV